MPPKKKYISESQKTRGLFDHLRALTEGTDPNYWTSLTPGERTEFSPYMVNRFLSMNPEWVEIVDELQRYTVGPIPKQLVFALYHEILPKGRVFLRYIKGKGGTSIPDPLASFLMMYFQSSEKEMRENFDMLMRSTDGKRFIVELIEAYGMQEKELKKIRKEIDV